MWTVKKYELFGLIFVIKHMTQADTNTTPAPQTYPGGRIATPVKVSKCCPENHNLNLTSPNQPVCVETDGALSPFVKMKGLEHNSGNASIVDIQLVNKNEETSSLPPCNTGFEVHRFESNGETITFFFS